MKQIAPYNVRTSPIIWTCVKGNVLLLIPDRLQLTAVARMGVIMYELMKKLA
jgi:hypothetical protein